MHPCSQDAIALAKKVDDSRMVQDERTARRRIDQVLDDETLHQRDLCVVEAPRAGEPVGLERRLGGQGRGAVKVLPPRQALVERKRVIQLHPDPQLELVEEGRPVEREKERERVDEVGCDTEEDLALAHVAPDETEVEELEVTKPAVDQPGRSGCGAGSEVGLLDESDLESAKGGVARDARTDDPAADNEEIDGAVAERPHRLISCGYLFALL